MVEENKTSFPMLPIKSWRTLRRQFQQSISDKVTTRYLASVLGIAEKSAQNNIFPYLKSMNLIDAEGKPTPLANKWRIDDTYAEACEEIKTKTYPRELLDAFPNPAENRAGVQSWFAMKTSSGKVAVSKMVTLYIILADTDPSKGGKPSTPLDKEKRTKVIKERISEPKKNAHIEEPQEFQKLLPSAQQDSHITGIPSIHIDVQIHISPEATADQVDQIFASMAKHLRSLHQP